MPCRFLLSVPGDRAPVLSYDLNFSALAPDDFRTGKEITLSDKKHSHTSKESFPLMTTLESRSKKETRENLFMYVVVCENLISETLFQCDMQEISFIKMIKVCSNKFYVTGYFSIIFLWQEIFVYKSIFNLLFVDVVEALLWLRKKLVKN